MATVIEEFATREDRDHRYRALKALKQKHVSRFSTSKLVERINAKTGEVTNEGIDIYCVCVGV